MRFRLIKEKASENTSKTEVKSVFFRSSKMEPAG